MRLLPRHGGYVMTAETFLSKGYAETSKTQTCVRPYNTQVKGQGGKD